MTISLRLALPLALLLVSAAPLPAAGFRNSGPPGGDVRILAVDPERPGVVYAEASGLFRSADGGESWSRLPLDVSPVAALAVFPGSGTLLAASGEELFRSLDDGASWSHLSALPPTWYGFKASVEEFIVSGSETGTVWSLASGELYRSTDEGLSWELVPIDVGGRVLVPASSLAIDPSKPSTLYAVAMARGVVRSLDRGAHWELVNTGLPESPFSIDAWSVAVDPNTPSTVYAGLDRGAVYLSLDGGAHWTATGEIGTFGSIRRISVDPVTSAVFATDHRRASYRSTDRGATWSALRIVPATGCAPRQVSRLVLAGDGRTVYAGPYGSGDAGTTWRSLGALASMPVISLALDPSGPGALFLAASPDLLRSGDGGATWRAATPGAADSGCAAFTVVAADSGGSGTVYGIRGGFPGEPLFRSIDGGSTWAPAGPSRFIFPRALAVSRADPKDLYLSVAGDHTPSARAAVPATADPFATALYRSRDGGDTVLSDGIPEFGARPIQLVLFDPRDPATVWAGGDALYRKRGSGGWSKLPLPAREFRQGSGFGLVTGIAFDPRTGAIYAAVGGAGVFRSLDDGASWTDASGNLPTDHLPWEKERLLPAATGLAVEPSTGRLFLSASTIDQAYGDGSVVRVPGGVYESSDGGTTWESVSEGLPAIGVDQLLLDTRGAPTLFAVTSSGLFVRDLASPLRLDALSPSSGSTDGGTLVLLSGDGFRPDSVVAVGSSPTTEFTFFSPQGIRVRTGAHPSGLGDVTVSNPDGTRATLPDAFLYASWSCEPNSTTLCLESGRFQVGVQGPEGAASAAPLTLKSGFFWFDWNQNPQVVVKILDGQTENGHYWIHISALTDARFTVRVTDRVSGKTRDYVNPAGRALSTIDRTSF
ncbi:MAG TPA: IPT/TIG domain-containing protein [Thermoanaerobaculia bacterium]|nr:IPT/TIG domain-containing protein [Thermoanaerobaculia bacterium]